MSKLTKAANEYADANAKYMDYYAERKLAFLDGAAWAMEKFCLDYTESGGMLDPAIWYMEHLEEMGD